MNKQIVRRQFRQYRECIDQLKQRLSELEQQAEESYYYHEEAQSRAIRQAEACRREAVERERQAESDRWYREDELRKATKDLERARSYGDEWGEARAIQKLKKIY